MSELTTLNSPSAILQHLIKIKTSICLDIDKYHCLEEKIDELSFSEKTQSSIKPVYEINSDNILGIVNFILYTVRDKIEEIDRQCTFLRILYDDRVYYSFDESSYMLSTILSAMEYLDSECFKDSLKNAMYNDDQKSTNVTEKSK